MPFLRGKLVRKRPLVARVSELKRNRVSAQFHSDIFFVDDKPYLLSVLLPISFGIVTYLSGRRTAAAVRRSMSEQLRLARSRGYVKQMRKNVLRAFVA